MAAALPRKGNGWLQGFKQRNGIRCIKVKGERASADESAAEQFILEFTNDVVMGEYTPNNIYNADETGIFWKILPDSTLSLSSEKQAYGSKLSKDRITLMVCANTSGTHKVDLMGIGKSARPRGFPKERSSLPIKYNNKINNSFIRMVVR